MTIELRQVYTVKYRRHRHGANDQLKQAWRGTVKGAAAHLAWRMIWDKYGDRYELSPELAYYDQSKLVRFLPTRFLCACDYELALYGDAPWQCCPLHNRDTGYYRRLHDRLAAFIVSTIRAQEVGGE